MEHQLVQRMLLGGMVSFVHHEQTDLVPQYEAMRKRTSERFIGAYNNVDILQIPVPYIPSAPEFWAILACKETYFGCGQEPS